MNNMEFKIFNDAPDEIMALRRDVFIVEKNVPEKEELDGKEKEHIHFGMYENESLIACLRAQTVGDGLLHIGRIDVKKDRRGKGLGRLLLEHLFTYAKENGFSAVELSAMDSAEGFYKKLGFVPEGDYYPEAGIPHIYMKKELQ